MRRWAMIQSGQVATVVVQDTKPAIAGTWAEIGGQFGPGDRFDGVYFSKPAPVARPRHISEGAFKDRLGAPLVVGIAASSHPVCLGLREMLNNRDFIDLDRADLPVMLAQMVALQLPAAVPRMPGSGPLTAEKVAQVLGAAVREDERP